MQFSRPRFPHYLAILAGAATVVLTGSGATAATQASTPQNLAPVRSAPNVPATDARGIDPSTSETGIDWTKVAQAGYKFAQMKATEGTYYTNPNYAAAVKGAKAAGLDAGGYHFANPASGGAAAQADYAVAHAGYVADGHTLPIELDIEYNPFGGECYGLSAASMVAWIKAFGTEVHAKTGRLPIIFTTADWWATCTGNSSAFGSYPLAVASQGASSPTLPVGWTTWTFWLYTDATVPGVSGQVGISYFNGNAAQLAAFIAGKSAVG